MEPHILVKIPNSRSETPYVSLGKAYAIIWANSTLERLNKVPGKCGERTIHQFTSIGSLCAHYMTFASP